MTQELIANMLGVRREGVTEGALKLQRAALISYVRGHIRVLDRPVLEKRVCECYAVVKKEYDRLLPALIATQGTRRPGQPMALPTGNATNESFRSRADPTSCDSVQTRPPGAGNVHASGRHRRLRPGCAAP